MVDFKIVQVDLPILYPIIPGVAPITVPAFIANRTVVSLQITPHVTSIVALLFVPVACVSGCRWTDLINTLAPAIAIFFASVASHIIPYNINININI